MTRMTRPETHDLVDPFDTLFRGFFRPVSLEREAPALRIDVREDENAYRVHADLPGVAKEDIHVAIDGNTVSIAAEVRRVEEARDGERVLRRERHTGRFTRSFALETEIDETQAQARYTDGVLELVLPKKRATTARRLTIQ